MRKYLLPSALILLFGLVFANAQVITRAIQLSQDTTGVFGVDANSGVYFPGHILNPAGNRPAPVLSACVTGGSPTLVGNDFAGVITGGTTASTSCVVTFGTAYVTAPNCVVTWQTGPLAAMSWTTSTTALTITQTSNASSKIAYMCTSAS
jgi:ABC-type phosphate/phosphonate transport system substrate-binding protein